MNTIYQLIEEFKVPVGYSDHVMGISTCCAAVAIGACVIEKHFTTDRNLPGPDHKISSDPDEFGQLVDAVHTIEASMGRACADVTRPDRIQSKSFRRGLYAKYDLPKGHIVTFSDILCVREENDFEPSDIEFLVGQKICKSISGGDDFTRDLLTQE